MRQHGITQRQKQRAEDKIGENGQPQQPCKRMEGGLVSANVAVLDTAPGGRQPVG
jgi:hypothetical protein